MCLRGPGTILTCCRGSPRGKTDLRQFETCYPVRVFFLPLLVMLIIARYTLTHITPEVIPQLLYVVIPIPNPFPSMMILVVGEQCFKCLQMAVSFKHSFFLLLRSGLRALYWGKTFLKEESRVFSDGTDLSYLLLGIAQRPMTV